MSVSTNERANENPNDVILIINRELDNSRSMSNKERDEHGNFKYSYFNDMLIHFPTRVVLLEMKC